MNAAFKSTPFFIWTRHRFLIVGTAAAYLLIALTFDAAWASSSGKQYVIPMLTYLSAAPFFLTLLLCSSTANVSTADLATGESWYPAHFLGLPLRASQLATAFMGAAVALFVVLTAAGMFFSNGLTLAAGRLEGPGGERIIQLWRPFLTLALLVWIQALIWMPFRRRWLRIGLLLAAVVIYFAILIFAIASGVPAAAIIAGAIALVSLAYLVAISGIAAARTGASAPGAAPIGSARATPASDRSIAQKPPFRSAFAAQTWFESKVQRTRAGVSATFIVPIVLFFTVLISAVGQGSVSQAQMHDAAALATTTLLLSTLVMITLVTGPAFATFEGTLQRFSKDATRMPIFFAALPMSTGLFAWAKLRAAAKRMGWIAFGMVAALIITCSLIGVPDSWAHSFASLRAQQGDAAAYALLGLAAAAFVGFTASSTANIVWTGLLGRHAQVIMTIITVLAAGVVLMPIWIRANPGHALILTEILSWLLPVLAVLKVGLLALLMYFVGSRRLYSWSRTCWIGGCWVSAVAGCMVLYPLYAPTSGLSELLHLLRNVVLALPVLGIVGAPLALHENRCR